MTKTLRVCFNHELNHGHHAEGDSTTNFCLLFWVMFCRHCKQVGSNRIRVRINLNFPCSSKYGCTHHIITRIFYISHICVFILIKRIQYIYTHIRIQYSILIFVPMQLCCYQALPNECSLDLIITNWCLPIHEVHLLNYLFSYTCQISWGGISNIFFPFYIKTILIEFALCFEKRLHHQERR